jgi:hypothetical protein
MGAKQSKGWLKKSFYHRSNHVNLLDKSVFYLNCAELLKLGLMR